MSYALPGEGVFPESVGVDTVTGDAFTGSLADGTLYWLPAAGGPAQVWLAGGPQEVAGVKVSADGRLWAAGGSHGDLWIYQVASGEPIARLRTGQAPSVVNDIAFGPDGTGYLTDSLNPWLYRVTGTPPRLERWADLSAIPWPSGLNLNGIILTLDASHLVSCQTNTGRLWRISLDGGRVDEVKLPDGPLPNADGLALDGSRLYVAVNALNQVAVTDLAPDGSEARLLTVLTHPEFAFPTSVAVRGGTLLVCNGQLDKMNGKPALPFTITTLPVPA